MTVGACGDAWTPSADLLGPAYAQHAESVLGRVRFELVSSQLLEVFPRTEGHVVDVGGGFGEQAIMLAREGFRVTVCDPDPDMLAMVKSRIQTLEEALASRVVLVPDDGRRLESLGAGECDAVLLHSVLMYFQDVRPFFEAASRVLKSTARVSVLSTNPRSIAMRSALQRRWDEALTAMQHGDEAQSRYLPTWTHDRDTLVDVAAEFGFVPEAEFGVRVFTDHLEDTDVPQDPAELAALLELERLAGSRDPYRSVARLYHLVLRRGG
ncbi:bifunctional 2-polyprenyl-6-hydroxyphenol methylase/3-demethylubiquinol 3-O-methyltransferase UbiG [Yimella sp. RIT 621]|uniref:class I SAM-dependent methyltransferase n=1 Tax=Yimella sp. RIT 621 TaxID=2510323 RepID=UPI001459FCE5|nr:class I SAM-dependent methyltransferase [Yimella sp. RIT 621]